MFCEWTNQCSAQKLWIMWQIRPANRIYVIGTAVFPSPGHARGAADSGAAAGSVPAVQPADSSGSGSAAQ